MVAAAFAFPRAFSTLAECDVVVHSLPPLLHSEIRASAKILARVATILAYPFSFSLHGTVAITLGTIIAAICSLLWSRKKWFRRESVYLILLLLSFLILLFKLLTLISLRSLVEISRIEDA